MNVHIFFIGGTGARAYRAFVHCLAAGMFSDILSYNSEFYTYLIDSDQSNGDRKKAEQTAELYQRVFQETSFEGEGNTGYPIFSNPLHHQDIVISNDFLRSELRADISKFSEDTQLLISALINNDAFFHRSDFEDESILTYLAMSSVKLEDFETKFDPQEDYVILVGSTFGNIGSSCFSDLILRTRRLSNEKRCFRKNPIAMVLVGPYFGFEADGYYRKCSFDTRHAVFINYFDKTLRDIMPDANVYDILPVEEGYRDLFKYVEEGSDQSHPAHVVEFCVVSAIVDFIRRQPVQRVGFSLKLGKKEYDYVYRFPLTPTDFPDEMRSQIDRLLCFSVWCRHFGGKEILNNRIIGSFSEDFCHWIQEMGDHHLSINPIDFKENQLSHSFFWYKSSKRFGFFNTDPLGSKKLDRQFRKELRSISGTIHPKRKGLLAQYIACASAWRDFKGFCQLDNLPTHINEWVVSKQHSFPPFVLRQPVNFSLPTLFSQIWICDIAFSLLAMDNLRETEGHFGTLHNIASECLDLLEFLFIFASHLDFTIRKISLSNVFHELELEDDNERGNYFKWKYNLTSLLSSDSWRFLSSENDKSNIYLFVFRGQVMGGTSPFSLVFISPMCKELFCSDVFLGEDGHRLFEDYIPFKERGTRFQEHLIKLMATFRHKSSIFDYIHSQLEETKKVASRSAGNQDYYLHNQSFNSKYTNITDNYFRQSVSYITEDGLELLCGHSYCESSNNSNTEAYNLQPVYGQSEAFKYLRKDVFSSIYAPTTVVRGRSFMVQLFFHNDSGSSRKITLQAKRYDPNTKHVETQELPVEVEIDDIIMVQLTTESQYSNKVSVGNPVKSFKWDGKLHKIQFFLSVSEDFFAESFINKLIIEVNHVPVVETFFHIQVSNILDEKPADITITKRNVESEQEIERSNLRQLLDDNLKELEETLLNTKDEIGREELKKTIETCKLCIDLVKHPFKGERPLRPRKVFVSSTCEKFMEPLREAVKNVILNLKMSPEMCDEWPQSGCNPTHVCCQKVLESDIYLGVLGGRYGYVEPSLKSSMTQVEYMTALSARKTILLFVIDPINETDEVEENRKKQEDFIDELKRTRILRTFSDVSDLSKLAKEDLLNLISKA
jgi:hypothetical protein